MGKRWFLMSTKVIVLKSCPFCGGDGGVSILPREQVVFGSCWSCGARSQPIRYHGRPTEQDITQAKEAWNRRVESV